MSTDLIAADCPVCHSAGTVTGERCQLCEAEFGEALDGGIDPPPAGSSEAAEPSEEPGFLRFSDVIDELRAVGVLVSEADGAMAIESACRRVQALLHALRMQFLNEVVLASPSGYPNRPVT